MPAHPGDRARARWVLNQWGLLQVRTHILSSVRLPLQLLQVPWRLVHLSLLSLTDLIPFHLLGCYLPSLSPALCCPWGCSNLTTLSCQSINFENFLTFKSWLYFPVSHPQPSFQNSHTIWRQRGRIGSAMGTALRKRMGYRVSPVAQLVKNHLPIQERQETWIQSESGRSSGGGNGNLLQYSCLENSMDRGTWRATVHWVPKCWTRLIMQTLLILEAWSLEQEALWALPSLPALHQATCDKG